MGVVSVDTETKITNFHDFQLTVLLKNIHCNLTEFTYFMTCEWCDTKKKDINTKTDEKSFHKENPKENMKAKFFLATNL